MPFYYNNETPTFRKWGANDIMNASIVLDQPGNASFTNLDQISGRVILKCAKSSDIESIIVKLEGESRTRLLSPSTGNEKPKPQLEYHKVLYKVQLVFPPPEVLHGRTHYGMGKNAYTLGIGEREYPFSFKLPFNNTCASIQGQEPTMNVSGSGVEIAKAPEHHIKTTLPPTLSGFPGEAEIRYFVKVTINRHYFWKENPRVYLPFNFFPIEPPRAAATGSETYARLKHSFTQVSDVEVSKSKMKSLFGKGSEPSSPIVSSEAPQISVDARLPEPAVLTCNDDIPLRIIVKKLNDCDAMIYLQSLQVSLVGNTKIRAHDVYRTESSSWIIVSKSNMGIPIGAASDAVNTENVISDQLWRGQVLPNTVAPTFKTCNIERSYQLDVRVGLSYTAPMQSTSKVRSKQIPRIPQSVVLPLRLDCEIYSGIAPPRELLEAMAEARASIRRRSTVDQNAMPEKLRTEKLQTEKLQTDLRQDSTASIPPTPLESSDVDPIPDIPAQQGSRLAQPPGYSDAPPSYEDAVASELPPVDIPRRPNYAPPPPGEDEVLRGDEKKNFMKRRNT